MEESRKFLDEFLSVMRDDLLNYFHKTHSYLRDLVSYKNFNLKKKVPSDNVGSFKKELDQILKAIKTGLNTIGVPIQVLTQVQNDFYDEVNKKSTGMAFFDSYLEYYLQNYINKILLDIIIEFISGLDTKKIETLKLFKLLPPSSLLKLNQLKEANLINSNNIESINQHFNSGAINFKDLTPKQEFNYRTKEEKESTIDILKQLEEAKKDSLSTLKIPKKEVLQESTVQIDKSYIQKEQTVIKPETLRDLTLHKDVELFLDTFGNLPSVHPALVTKIKININNLLNSRIVNPDFFDIENLFYYVSILKLIGIDIPFSQMEISEIIKKFVSNNIFIKSDKDIPDTITNFHGIALMMELGLPTEKVSIDFESIGEFITKELMQFIPGKFRLNYYAFLSTLLLGQEDTFRTNKNVLIDQVRNINLLQENNLNLISDIYYQMSILKIIDKNIDLNEYKRSYIIEIKKHVISEGVGGDLLTESAKMLLILDLFNLKEEEAAICNRLLNFLTSSTSFFSLDNLDKDFNWRIDKLAYTVELKMAFWALLASSQYAPLNSLYI
ncbi:MAG: hypothetical protein ACW990_04150 [Promethearchaeota archaeon]|jgi:hypothetical protein